jgi:hypothetical protein
LNALHIVSASFSGEQISVAEKVMTIARAEMKTKAQICNLVTAHYPVIEHAEEKG